MTANPGADNPLLMSVAASIAAGVPIDWQQVPSTPDAETTAAFDALRVIEGVSRMSHPIPDTWGPFTITGEIGHGSYGTVYRAFDSNLNLEVALKVIGPHETRPCVDASRALNEARLLAQVTHPNVVRVYRAECVGREMGLSMELVRGRTFKDLVGLQGPFSAREAMLIGIDVCRALAAVHRAGLVHGDIKAENVMRATGGRTVLMDFGAGYDVKSDPSSGRRFVGTPLYLAPEVFAGATRSTVSDIYSAGVLLYYLATGSYPVEGHSRSEVKQRHETQAPRRLLRDVRPDLPDAFIRVVDRAIAVRQEERYHTAGELEAALNWALKVEGPTPVNPPRPAVWPKVAFAAAAVLALGFGLGYTSWNPLQGTDSGAASQRAAAPVPQSPGAAATAPADTYRIEAAFYREQAGTSIRLESGARVAPGDRLSLRVASSVPTYVYVVNEDDRGESFLLFPLSGQRLANPIPVGARNEIPGVVDGERIFWTVSSAGGREHFLIFASPQPLSPAFARMFDQLPRPSSNTRVLARSLTGDMVGALRGVGGLSKAPGGPAGARLTEEFGAPLPSGEETARGVWVRQLTLENPRE